VTKTAKHPRLATFGGLILDSVIAADGSLSLSQIGGNGVYSALGARLWSQDVAVVASVPANYPSHHLEVLSSVGIELAGLKHFPEVVTCEEWFFYREDGSREDQYFASSEEARRFGLVGPCVPLATARAWKIFLSQAPREGLGFGRFRQLHRVTSDYIPKDWTSLAGAHLAPEDPECQIEIARTLRREGVLITLDPGASIRNYNETLLAAILAVVDVFLPSEKELAALTGNDDPSESLRALARLGKTTLVVKLGARGSLILDPLEGKMHHVYAYPAQAVDPTGAGDAYCGGFLAAFVETRDALHAARCGTVSASFAVEHFGAVPSNLPDQAERDRRLRETKLQQLKWKEST
jgi:ribokinase